MATLICQCLFALISARKLAQTQNIHFTVLQTASLVDVGKRTYTLCGLLVTRVPGFTQVFVTQASVPELGGPARGSVMHSPYRERSYYARKLELNTIRQALPILDSENHLSGKQYVLKILEI